MGGHGGLNILPQKRWNVYNFDNREKVKQDEEAAAKEEQLKREQSRKRDAEFRLEQLRTARGLAPLLRSESSQTVQVANSHEAEPQSKVLVPEPELEPESNHINLFEGIKIFDPVSDSVSGGGGDGKRKRRGEEEEKGSALKKMKKKEDPPRTVGPEDEKYRLGYGIAGKGVKLPWYLSKPSVNVNDSNKADDRSRIVKEKSKSSGRKTLEELREERLKREKKEKERERALIVEKKSSRRDDRYGSNKRDFGRRKSSF